MKRAAYEPFFKISAFEKEKRIGGRVDGLALLSASRWVCNEPRLMDKTWFPSTLKLPCLRTSHIQIPIIERGVLYFRRTLHIYIYIQRTPDQTLSPSLCSLARGNKRRQFRPKGFPGEGINSCRANLRLQFTRAFQLGLFIDSHLLAFYPNNRIGFLIYTI